MQATVSGFDVTSRRGRVVRDDGVELAFDETAIAGTGLRLLRPGQRVQVEATGEGAGLRVVRVRIVTMP